MVEDIVSIRLPVDETFRIRKNVIRNRDGKRLCVVTGVHGDELEGQYVCFLLSRILNKHPELLHGSVEIYPAVNPLGIGSIERGIPGFDIDMNRTFPGSDGDVMTEYIARALVDDLAGADVVFDIHASNIFLTEIPQVRINELHRDALVPLAKRANVDMVWVHANSTVLESTLAYSLNSIGTPCLVVEMGVGMRLTGEYGEQLTNGILSVMQHLGMWDGATVPVKTPIVSDERDEVIFLNAQSSGMFMKTKPHGSWVSKGESVGYVFDPFEGKVVEYVTAAKSGLLFTIRDYPLVDEGSLMGRILVRGAEA